MSSVQSTTFVAMEEHDDTDTDARDSSLGDSMLFFEYDDDNDNEEENDENDIYARPIVVGYAFGVKKMSTMSVVMAEASKAKLSAVPESATVECCLAEDNTTNAVTSGGGGGDAICHDVVCRGEEEPTVLLAHTTTTTTKILSTHNPRHYKAAAAACIEPELEQAETMNGNHKRAEQEDAVVATNNFVFTIATEKIQGGGGSCSDLRNIVQHFRSSFCSSVGGGESAGGGSTGNTACSTFSVTSLPRTYSVSGSTSVASSLRKNPSANTPTPPRDESKVIPVRVSFVPLDLDIPLEEQHGGKMDVILHKLTEDILCLSQMATERQRMNHLPSSNKTNESSRCTESLTQRYDEHGVVAEYPQQQQHQLAAVRRVQRLMDFHREHPECSLVDSPMAVQTLMSRADIAVTLQACLLTVHTVSGVPVGSPAYAVIGKQQPQQQCEAAVVATAATASIEEQVANLSFPIIVKPLTAAGSKASHAMAVLLDRTALQQVVVKVPCLCQEYSNHDGFLYKVYVLGDYVSVHKRRSLPNLPKNQASTLGFVEFDSQRPYPRLSDFGFAEVYLVDEAPTIVAGTVGSSGECQSLRINDGAAAASTHSTAKPAVVITAEEVKPVVDALREAFGLDLFGFDILITNTHVGDDEGQRRKMLVVDVNYFPSYKEVPNFPELLAKYLTDRAFASRRKACAARSRRASAH